VNINSETKMHARKVAGYALQMSITVIKCPQIKPGYARHQFTC